MKKLLTGTLLCLVPTLALAAEAILAPDWAYTSIDPNYKRAPDDGLPKHVPGSDQAFLRREITDFFGVKDWFPNEHAPMPEVVVHGRRPDVRACAVCHLPNGQGHPESASVAGMPAEYFFQQMKEFQNGKRKNSLPSSSTGMTTSAAAIKDDEIRDAANYFASLKPTRWITVKETDTVPVTWIGTGNLRHVKPDGGTEPLGRRIIEVPEDEERVELRDPHSGFIAYVPVGSVKAGEALASNGGNGKTVACATCHGEKLTGLANVPRLAGQHPGYIVRQLLDFKQGSRDGTGAPLMKPVVDRLSLDDMIDLAAYLASLPPS